MGYIANLPLSSLVSRLREQPFSREEEGSWPQSMLLKLGLATSFQESLSKYKVSLIIRLLPSVKWELNRLQGRVVSDETLYIWHLAHCLEHTRRSVSVRHDLFLYVVTVKIVA